MATGVSLLGVRHPGPCSARSVAAVLDVLEPDAVLVEGPPEAEAVAALAIDRDMVPPVALLAYVPGDPERAAFWPFAEFSPEWHAVRHALERSVPLRFIDLPAAHLLVEGEDPEPASAGEDEVEGDPLPLAQRDPLGVLARA